MITMKYCRNLAEGLRDQGIAFDNLGNNIHIFLQKTTDSILRRQMAAIFYALWGSFREEDIRTICNQFDDIFGSTYSNYSRSEELWAVSQLLEVEYNLQMWWKDDGRLITKVEINE